MRHLRGNYRWFPRIDSLWGPTSCSRRLVGQLVKCLRMESHSFSRCYKSRAVSQHRVFSVSIRNEGVGVPLPYLAVWVGGGGGGRCPEHKLQSRDRVRAACSWILRSDSLDKLIQWEY